jgi:ABC-2 type transport system ATP-binding protein
MATTTDPILRIIDLNKVYGKGEAATTAVDNLSLDIPRGSFFGLLGPNGAGKSTTIHCITGISQPTSGQILIDGTDVVKEYKLARTKVGLSPQEFNVNIFNTPEQIIDYMGGYYGIRKAERHERREELLTQFDLQKYRKQEFKSLSGGQKRRVILARALIHTPDLLILDEPTAGVDVKQRYELWEYLRKLNTDGKTIILTSHYLEEVQALCNDIAIINHGRIVAHATKEEFLKDGKSLEQRYLEITKEAA